MSTAGRSWKMIPARERLFSRLIIDPSGCLLWTGAKVDGGYGQIAINRRRMPVHRVMYELFAGPIPDGLVLDHLCRNPPCANPSHLEPVTSAENTHRGVGLTAENAKRTHCPAGHPYDEANTYLWRGRRICRACDRARHRVTTP